MGFFDKIKQGLAKTREAISETFNDIFSVSELDDDFYDELEESLILADLGMETASKATERLKKAVSARHIRTAEEAREALREILVDMLNVGSPELNLKTLPSVILVIGVNGVGKTTTIGKIAKQQVQQGKRVLLVPDGTTGQNGLIQAKQFKEIAGVTAMAVTKLDGTAKGGIVIAVADALQIPVKFIGVGEKEDDLMPFVAEDFVKALF